MASQLITSQLAAYAKIYEHIQPHFDKVPLVFSVKGSIVAMFVIVYTAKWLEIALSIVLLRFYDNVQHGGAKKSGKGTWAERLVQRANLAHNNHWEAFISFSVAVILALSNVKEQKELQVLANAFIFVRLAYNVAYILAANAPLSVIRSSIWFIGVTILFRIFTLAVPNILA